MLLIQSKAFSFLRNVPIYSRELFLHFVLHIPIRFNQQIKSQKNVCQFFTAYNNTAMINVLVRIFIAHKRHEMMSKIYTAI